MMTPSRACWREDSQKPLSADHLVAIPITRLCHVANGLDDLAENDDQHSNVDADDFSSAGAAEQPGSCSGTQRQLSSGSASTQSHDVPRPTSDVAQQPGGLRLARSHRGPVLATHCSPVQSTAEGAIDRGRYSPQMDEVPPSARVEAEAALSAACLSDVRGWPAAAIATATLSIALIT
jgi:hypothetical protein